MDKLKIKIKYKFLTTLQNPSDALMFYKNTNISFVISPRDTSNSHFHRIMSKN